MEYVSFARTGLKVSRICFGCMSYGNKKWREWVLEEPAPREHFKRAIEAGINFFDTANVYSTGVSEEITGKYLREFGIPRDQLVLATKVCGFMGPGPNMQGLSRKHILQQCDASLRRLGMDYIDLYQIHRWDPTTPIEETLDALDSLVRAGKVRYLGASSMAAWQFAKAQFTADRHGWHRFVSMQNLYNLAYREEEREMIPFCIDQGVGLIPWSPLHRGVLTMSSRLRGGQKTTLRANTDPIGDAIVSEQDYDVADAVKQVAQSRGVPMSQVAIAWLLQAPGVVAPIFGTTNATHIDEVVGALALKLSAEEIAALEAPYRPHPVLGYPHPKPADVLKGWSR